jgi:aspartate 1-decarboxylase
MNRILLKSKIHRATVTQAELHYEGSVTIDLNLLELADIVEFEQVQIYNVTNGNRLTTYAIEGERDSGVICINGAAAHLVRPGDMIIICTYAQFATNDCESHSPKIIFVDGKNRPKPRATREI